MKSTPHQITTARAAPPAVDSQRAQGQENEYRPTPREQLILFALFGRELYGLELQRIIEECSNGQETLSLGAIYPVLRTLEDRGLAIGRWGEETPGERAGARRRYYRLSDAGATAVKHILDYHQRLLNWNKSQPCFEWREVEPSCN